MTAPVDVAILGGGPAGLAAATVLARRGRSVVVLERAAYDESRAGETFGAEVRPLLEELGAADLLQGLPRVPFRGVRSAWGGSDAEERPSILKPLGEGLHVERARFDALLAANARRAGADVRTLSGACAVTATGDGFQISVPKGDAVAARFLVDASGRGAPASARGVGARRWISLDRLVGIVARVAAPAPVEPELVIEAAEDGWWYAAPQPDGTLLLSLLTDADLVAAGPRAELAPRLRAALRRTSLVEGLAGSAPFLAPPRIVRADSGFSSPHRGQHWMAVGDAAFACDPLAGDGVVRALRAGLAAAGEIDERLVDPRRGTEEEARARVEAYLERRRQYYALETRWPNSLFWARRHARDWSTAPLVLDPRQRLRTSGGRPDARATAPAEALLPRSAIAAVFEQLRAPAPAHEALALLRSRAPLADRRLLVGLQVLLERGCVEAV